MSRLTDLISRAKAKDTELGDELEREFKILSARRPFGLNFERHRPESVELPHHPIRKGNKVRVLPPRGSATKGDQRLWKVLGFEGEVDTRMAQLVPLENHESEKKLVSVEDLVVVAEFRDYIYPGLVSTGRIAQGNDKPYHAIINGENFHVLEALTYTHRGKIDAVYIDPPYNTGARDWKYNNDYVEEDDLYRHSKWLAFMERRLKITRELLNPNDSVLIVTIDEKEVHRLALLLEQTFPEASIQMVTSIINAKGTVRPGKFSRVEEHIFYVCLGESAIAPWIRNMIDPLKGDGRDRTNIPWLLLRRTEPTSIRPARKNQFYPIFVHEETGFLHSIGDPIMPEVDRHSILAPEGTVALWPLKPKGVEMLWGLTPGVLRRNWEKGFARVNRWDAKERTGTVQYLQRGIIDQINEGRIMITGKAPDGSVIGTMAVDEAYPTPKRVWNLSSHNAEVGGTHLLTKLIPSRRFPFPKSLYAVEDCLRFVLSSKKDAIILDYFAGSGTTAHAIMRLNRQDEGRRQCISVTNNEVAAVEHKSLTEQKLRPGDTDWEKCGICDQITKPRINAAISGQTPDGKEIEGEYKFTDEFPLAEGFEENAEFFTLTYETPIIVSHNRAFERIAPLLWMRAGSEGRRIDTLPAEGWEMADTYALLVDLDKATPFCNAVVTEGTSRIRTAYIVTDDERRFQAVTRNLPVAIETIRLYESYLANFRFALGR